MKDTGCQKNVGCGKSVCYEEDLSQAIETAIFKDSCVARKSDGSS